MKKYLLFAGDKFYPAGGWQDFKAAFETLTDALIAAGGGSRNLDLQGSWDWWHIVDLSTGKIIEEGTSAFRLRNPDQDE